MTAECKECGKRLTVVKKSGLPRLHKHYCVVSSAGFRYLRYGVIKEGTQKS